MTKKLYIRFFQDREKVIPNTSWIVSDDDELSFEIRQWLLSYPNGKVDFVLLD